MTCDFDGKLLFVLYRWPWHCCGYPHRLSRAGLHHSNHAVLPNTLPRQSEHESSQLLVRDLPTRVGSGLRPDELSPVHPPGRQPDSGPVVDEYLHAVGTTIGEVDEAAQQRPLGYRTGRRDLVKVLRKMRNTSPRDLEPSSVKPPATRNPGRASDGCVARVPDRGRIFTTKTRVMELAAPTSRAAGGK